MKNLTFKINVLSYKPCLLGGLFICFCLIFTAPSFAQSKDQGLKQETSLHPQGRLQGSYIPADVLRIYDGDSVKVRAYIWLGQELVITVRMAGIDTPELKARCTSEREKAVAAKSFLKKQLEDQTVFLTEIKPDKYSNRIVAKIIDDKGRDINQIMIDENHARPYHGQKRKSWCS